MILKICKVYVFHATKRRRVERPGGLKFFKNQKILDTAPHPIYKKISGFDALLWRVPRYGTYR